MAVNRAAIVDENFIQQIRTTPPSDNLRSSNEVVPGTQALPGWKAIEMFKSMLESRHIDIYARKLKAMGEGFYTIGASGHESNAAVAAAARVNDLAFLHYRSGAFFIQRSKLLPGTSALYDILLGMVASSEEPIAGGRHKVYGSVPLSIPPQTSTIASHLPKAVGAAFSISRQARLKLPSKTKSDSIVLCTFGDASANHSTACGAFNTAALADHQKLPCPVLFICEDNGIGISVRTPKNWLERRFSTDPGIKYFKADGLNLFETYEVACQAVEYVRQTRRPTFLHLKLIRLLGHAGSDVEQLYRKLSEIEKLEAMDPVLQTARSLIEYGFLTSSEILTMYEEIRERLERLGNEAIKRPKLTQVSDIIAPLAPIDHQAIKTQAEQITNITGREEFWGRLPEVDRPRHMAMLLNRALGDILLQYPESLIFGEDVGKKGGVYHVTADLQKKTSVGRVFNTPLDETTILGLAIGAGQIGMLPIPEIQYLAYLHNAIDQIRGEACSQLFFSKGQFSNPMVVRIASLAYQKGFGGHFHNANAIASLRDIPGLVIACPSNGRDAVAMLRTCIAAAKVNSIVCAFLEPIALYMTKDLHEPKDGLWSFTYPLTEHHVAIGSAHTWTDGEDITIFTYANGLWMTLRVAKRLESRGIKCRVVDLRWLNPLPEQDILREAAATGKVLVVDECRRTGGVAEGVMTLIAENNPSIYLQRVTGVDTYIPLGDAANLVLVQEQDIEDAILRTLGVSHG